MKNPPLKKPRTPCAPDMAYLERAALYYLERFSTSSANFAAVLKRKILKRCYARGEDPEPYYKNIAPLVARYLEAGLLNDVAYTQAKVASMRRRGTSARMIQAKLAAKGLVRELVNQHIDSDEICELEAARTAARKKRLGKSDTPEDRQKRFSQARPRRV